MRRQKQKNYRKDRRQDLSFLESKHHIRKKFQGNRRDTFNSSFVKCMNSSKKTKSLFDYLDFLISSQFMSGEKTIDL